MKDKVFLDTNIIVYAHDRSSGDKHVVSKDIMDFLWESRKGVISVQVLQEFYVNVTQKVAKPLAPDVAARIITDLSVWQIHRPGVEDVLDAIHLQGRYQISFWDAMIVASAIQLGCRRIWSEDLGSGRVYTTVTVTSPF